MSSFKERREMKIEQLRQTLTREEQKKHKEDYETVSNRSRKSFSRVSRKSVQEIRDLIASRSS